MTRWLFTRQGGAAVFTTDDLSYFTAAGEYWGFRSENWLYTPTGTPIGWFESGWLFSPSGEALFYQA
jgi:hypothetical protein